MFKHIVLILLIPAMALFCQCNNANANKSNGGNSKSTAVKQEQPATTANSTVKSVQAPADMPASAASEMNVSNNTDAEMLYASKEDEKKHAVSRKNNKNVKTAKVTYTQGNFPEGSERKLTEWDVTHLSKWGYTLMINEIYARHSMRFTDPKLVKYFRKVKWYKPRNKNVDKLLTPIERENLAFLRSPAVVALPR